jgi:hypothetical protein
MTIMFNNFEGSIYTNIIGLALVIFCLVTMLVGVYGIDTVVNDFQSYIVWLIYAAVVWYYQLRIMQNVNRELIHNLLGKIEQKGQFELIFENLEESLIIIEKDHIELVNEQFLNYFRNIIINNQ